MRRIKIIRKKYSIRKYVIIIHILFAVYGCSSTRSIIIESSRPVRIDNAQKNCIICRSTPCAYTFSRETCWGYDSSSGYIMLKAVTEDGLSKSIALKTCDIEENERVFFDFNDGKKAEPDKYETFLKRTGRKQRDCPCRKK